ncbi:hypothetical protein BDV98DRAFT_575523 [Pterulicium gracile]|uniref:F-box domain-containing protein n=1 Tax=Pterulicium gracile TaxID=1884261 RepID=A0A5C3Q739_9AGAR|nr:hypothetical protein BDV98DRAFT_575523 [Pterula gracilis]
MFSLDLSPVRILPCERNLLSWDHRDPREGMTAWTLSHVNRRWREVAVCAPQLWAKILLALPLPPDSDDSDDDILHSRPVGWRALNASKLLQLQLRLSRSIPSHVDVSSLRPSFGAIVYMEDRVHRVIH